MGRSDGVWGGIGVGGGNGDDNGVGGGNEDVNGHGDGDGGGAGTGVEVNEEAQGGNGNGNGDRIGECGGEAKKRKKPQKRCRRHVGNGGDLSGKKKNVENKGLVQ